MGLLTVEAATRPPRRRPPRWRPRHALDFPTLGWGILAWAYKHIPSPADERQPFVFTSEQAARLLRFYQLDPKTGERLYRRIHLEEAKGWGKSPFAAAIALAELAGPVCFDGWDADGQPRGAAWGTGGRQAPWIQIAAVSEDQTENTYKALYELITTDDHRAARELGIDEGRTRLYLRGVPSAFLERVTASAGSREGQRLTMAVLDEPQLWTPANGGVRLARTILRNSAKTDGWALFTGNAPVMGEESVSEVYSDPVPGVLHMANRPSEMPERDWPEERLRAALDEVYGDAWWIERGRLLAEIADPAHPWEDSLRFFFNIRISGGGLRWMPGPVWAAAKGTVDLDAKLPAYAAVALGHDHRTAAVATAQRQGDGVAVRVRHFPEEPLLQGDYLPLADIEAHLRSLAKSYPARVLATRRFSPKGKEYPYPSPGPEVVYHGSFFEGSAQRLAARGLVMVDIPLSQERLAPAAETVMQLATAESLVHDGDPELGRQMGLIHAKPAPKGWTLEPPSEDRERPVAALAAMVAIHRAMTAPRPPSNRVRGIRRR